MRNLAQPFFFRILLAFALTSGCAVQSPEAPAGGRVQALGVCNSEAQEALDAGDLAQARQGFLQGVAAARRSGNAAENAACSFYLGLVAQREAQRDDDPDLRRERLGEAAKWYEAALPAGPQAPGLVANLARVYFDLGQRQRANQLVEKSLPRMQDGAKAALARSYAKLIEKDDWARSAELYRMALKIVPADDKTWEEFLSLLQRKAPVELPAAVREAVKAGQTDSAQEAALAALKTSSLPDRTRIDLLAALVAGLAEQHYVPASFASSEVARELESLRADPTIGQGVEQVLLAHQRLDPKESFAWWAEKKGSDQQHPPLTAFRSLLRSLAMRTDPGDPLAARVYLMAADKLSPEFDPLVSADLVANYAVTGDYEKIKSSERRWAPMLERASHHLDPDAVQRYELTLEGTRLIYAPDTQRCVSGSPPNCPKEAMRLEVPDLFPKPEDQREGISRVALIEIGCQGRHFLGYRASQQVTGRETRIARFAPIQERLLSRPTLTSRTVNVAATYDAPSAVSECRHVPLAAQPAWLSSAAWEGEAHLLLADALRGQLLRYALDGTLLDAAPAAPPDGDAAYVRVQPSSAGDSVAEDGFGRLLWGHAPTPKRISRLTGRTGHDGTLKSIFQWALLGDREALAIANLLDAKGSWTSAVVRLSLAGNGYEILQRIDVKKPASILYRVGIPALAAVGDVGYFLTLEQDLVGLYRVPPGGKPQRLTGFPGIEPGLRGGLARNQDMRRTPDLFRLLERTHLPAGLYGVGNDLLLLRRVPKEKQSPGWALTQLDPRTGRMLRTVSLPTTARHLTAAPGARSWAFFEKGSVTAIGRQATPSMLLVPTAWIQGKALSPVSSCN